MKVLLEIKDSKATHLMEVLKGLSYVKTTPVLDEKEKLKNQIRQALKEVKLIRAGKLKGISAKELLDEL